MRLRKIIYTSEAKIKQFGEERKFEPNLLYPPTPTPNLGLGKKSVLEMRGFIRHPLHSKLISSRAPKKTVYLFKSSRRIYQRSIRMSILYSYVNLVSMEGFYFIF